MAGILKYHQPAFLQSLASSSKLPDPNGPLTYGFLSSMDYGYVFIK